MMYQPDPFFEAESVGPAVTFGQEPAVRVTHGDVQAEAKALFRQKYGHDAPQSLEEANWLDELVKQLKAKRGVTKFVKVTTPAGEEKVVEVSPTPPPSPGWWGGMTTGGKMAVAGGAGLGVLALVMFGRRRKNPRRGRMLPILAVGGVAALLFWGGKKTVETAEAAITP